MSEACFTISIYINPFESLVVLLSYTIFYSNSSSHLKYQIYSKNINIIMKFTTAIVALVSSTTLVMAWPDKGEYAKRGVTDGVCLLLSLTVLMCHI